MVYRLQSVTNNEKRLNAGTDGYLNTFLPFDNSFPSVSLALQKSESLQDLRDGEDMNRLACPVSALSCSATALATTSGVRGLRLPDPLLKMMYCKQNGPLGDYR